MQHLLDLAKLLATSAVTVITTYSSITTHIDNTVREEVYQQEQRLNHRTDSILMKQAYDLQELEKMVIKSKF